LSFQNADFVMQSIVYTLLFFDIQWSFRNSGNLSIRRQLHYGWLLWFSFSFIQASLSSFHFFVTFIYVKIELVLSALRDCLATRIFPVMFFTLC